MAAPKAITTKQHMRLVESPHAPVLIDRDADVEVAVDPLLIFDAPLCMAEIIRAARNNRYHLLPEAVGLGAVSMRRYCRVLDDHQRPKAGMSLCDALFRRTCDGFGEGHA